MVFSKVQSMCYLLMSQGLFGLKPRPLPPPPSAPQSCFTPEASLGDVLSSTGLAVQLLFPPRPLLGPQPAQGDLQGLPKPLGGAQELRARRLLRRQTRESWDSPSTKPASCTFCRGSRYPFFQAYRSMFLTPSLPKGQVG